MAIRYLIRIEGTSGRSLVETDADDVLGHAWRSPAAHPAAYEPPNAKPHVRDGHYVCSLAAGVGSFDAALAAAGLDHWFDGDIACSCASCLGDAPLADQVHRELAQAGASVRLYECDDACDMPGPQVMARRCDMRLVAEATVDARRGGWIERAVREIAAALPTAA